MERFSSLGGILSFACAVHCALTPFVVTALPLIGMEFLAEESFETPLALILIALVLTGRFFAEDAAETACMIGGGLALACCAWINHRLCRSCHKCK